MCTIRFIHDCRKKNSTKNYRCAPNKSMQNVKERHINSMISFFREFIWNLVKWLEFLFHSKNWGLFRKSRGHAIISFAIKTIEFVFVWCWLALDLCRYAFIGFKSSTSILSWGRQNETVFLFARAIGHRPMRKKHDSTGPNITSHGYQS